MHRLSRQRQKGLLPELWKEGEIMDYIYHGDKLSKLTSSPYAGKLCKAVRNDAGKCIRGKNSNMLVEFEGGVKAVILARMLRKVPPQNI